eukprot:13421680-Alexandrium_andersonii.AAC.1
MAASAQEAADWVAARGRYEVHDAGDGEPGDACPICLAGGGGRGWMGLSCGHALHFGCLARHRAAARNA